MIVLSVCVASIKTAFIQSGTCKRTVNIPVYDTKSIRKGANKCQQRNSKSNVATVNIVKDIAVPEIPEQAFPANIRTNATFTIILYKKVVSTLRKANLIPKSTSEVNVQKKAKVGLIIVSAVILIGCILALLIIGGVI